MKLRKKRKEIFNFINHSRQRRNRGIIKMLFETIKRYQKRKFYMAEKIYSWCRCPRNSVFLCLKMAYVASWSLPLPKFIDQSIGVKPLMPFFKSNNRTDFWFTAILRVRSDGVWPSFLTNGDIKINYIYIV